MSDLYSLWLVPEEGSAVYDHLSSFIQSYAERYEDAPVFEPHVTAVGGLEFDYRTVKEAAGTLADRNPPVEITLTRSHVSTTRHQCVFLLAEPTKELLEFHKEGSDLLDTEPGMYIPHLSLLYSDVGIEERERVMEELDIDLPVSFTTETLWMVDTGSEDEEEWETVEEYSLS